MNALSTERKRWKEEREGKQIGMLRRKEEGGTADSSKKEEEENRLSTTLHGRHIRSNQQAINRSRCRIPRGDGLTILAIRSGDEEQLTNVRLAFVEASTVERTSSSMIFRHKERRDVEMDIPAIRSGKGPWHGVYQRISTTASAHLRFLCYRHFPSGRHNNTR